MSTLVARQRCTRPGPGRHLAGGADVPERTCSIPGCNKPHAAHGWCGTHYMRYLRHGDPLADPSRRKPVEPRFWARVNKTKGCWLWTGGKAGKGYGVFRPHTDEPMKYVHRFAYELLVGPIPEGYTIDHVKANGCTSILCVKAVADEYGPAHLEPVTLTENLRRGDGFSGRNARKTHCPKGHPLDGVNRLGRHCKTCKREQARARYARRREEENYG